MKLVRQIIELRGDDLEEAFPVVCCDQGEEPQLCRRCLIAKEARRYVQDESETSGRSGPSRVDAKLVMERRPASTFARSGIEKDSGLGRADRTYRDIALVQRVAGNDQRGDTC